MIKVRSKSIEVQPFDKFRAKVCITGWLHDPIIKIEGIYLESFLKNDRNGKPQIQHRTWLDKTSCAEIASIQDVNNQEKQGIYEWNDALINGDDSLFKITGNLTLEEALTHESLVVRRYAVGAQVKLLLNNG